MSTKAKLYGLVLSGGKSSRMGRDKGTISYHGLPQREYMYHLLDQFCECTFLSVRKDQKTEVPAELVCIVDGDVFPGPFNGILSAHLEYPDVAWLVVACDMPLLDSEHISLLIQARDPGKDATAYAGKHSALPEPLCAIWEPRVLKKAVRTIAAGKGSGPRNFLLHASTKMVRPEDDRILTNINSDQEYEEIMKKQAY